MGEYKIKDIEILTGIKAHTLRIWEKRYGIPSPSRTEKKIRNYSDEDLKEILNVAILNKNGLKISRIAELDLTEKQVQVNLLRLSENEDIYHENLMLSLLEMDERLFLNTIADLQKKFGVYQTFSVYLTKFLERIGILWLTGAIQPGQEHFITNLIRQKLISYTDALPLPDKKSTKVLIFLPENEWHELSSLFYHYILREHGINSLYLGQSLPYSSIVDIVKTIQPAALLTSCIASMENNFFESYFEKLKKDSGNLPIFAGGSQIVSRKKELSKWVIPICKLEDLEQLFALIV